MILEEFIRNGCGKNVSCVIYKFTNLVNGKIYIGQTKNSLRKRVISHLSQSNNNNKHKKHYFQRALYKYGLTNFDIEILETCDYQNLNNREIYWINHFNTTDPELGYNCTFGGQGNRNAYEISESTRQKISKVHKKLWENQDYKQHQSETHKRISRDKFKQTVLQLDFNGDIIKEWNSKAEIRDQYSYHIYDLRGNTKKVYMKGFMWMLPEDRNKMLLSTPKIVQLDYNYNLVNTFFAVKDANYYIINLTGKTGNLDYNLKGKFVKIKGTKKAGYIWMYYSDYINKLKIKSK